LQQEIERYLLELRRRKKKDYVAEEYFCEENPAIIVGTISTCKYSGIGQMKTAVENAEFIAKNASFFPKR